MDPKESVQYLKEPAILPCLQPVGCEAAEPSLHPEILCLMLSYHIHRDVISGDIFRIKFPRHFTSPTFALNVASIRFSVI
jgi:hypothetical protein